MEKIWPILLLLILSWGMASAQNGKLRRADELFERNEYEKAIEWYEYGLKKDRSTEAMQRLSIACMANRHYEKAEYWLSQLTTELGLEPRYYFYYAQILLTNGKPEEANKWFYAYGNEGGNAQIAEGYMALVAKMMNGNSDPGTTQVKSVSFNSPFTDFGPQWYEEGLAFASERKNFAKGMFHRSLETQTPLLNLYQVKPDGEGWGNPKPLDRRLNTTMHEGPLCFSPDGSRMYFNRSQPIRLLGSEVEGPILGIYVSQKGEKSWGEPEMLPMPDADAICLHPAVSPDGKWLVFASNKAGGVGGFDLYKISLEAESPGKPISLGSTLNTPFDELFPSFHESGRLYFASTGHPGYGGLDLFETRPVGEGWAAPRNLGLGLNSPYDDFSILLNEDRSEGFFASNRGSQDMNDDLYQCWVQQHEFENCPPEAASPLCYKYYEKGTKSDLPYQLIYEWDFGDGNKERGVRARHCYQEYGNYMVTLTAIDSLSGEAMFSQAQYQLNIIPPTGPVITLEDSALVPGRASFSASGTQLKGYSIEGYYWNFGSGFTQGGPRAEAIFDQSGPVEIQLGLVTFNQKTLSEERFCVSKTFEVSEEAGEPMVQAVLPDTGQVAIEFSVIALKRPEFRIQLGTSTERVRLDDPVFQGMNRVVEVEDNGVYRYFFDSYGDQDSALSDIEKYRRKGFPRAVAMTFEDDELKSPRIFRENWLPNAKTNPNGWDGTAVLQWKNVVKDKVILEEAIDLAKIDSLVNSPDRTRYVSFENVDAFFPVDYNLNLFNRTNPLNRGEGFKLANMREVAAMRKPVRFNEVFYAPKEYRVPGEAYQEIFRITRFLLENPDLKVEIIGHADRQETGGEKIAFWRASAVAQFLVLSGCRAESLILVNGGTRFPLLSNISGYDGELNRRVEFRIRK